MCFFLVGYFPLCVWLVFFSNIAFSTFSLISIQQKATCFLTDCFQWPLKVPIPNSSCWWKQVTEKRMTENSLQIIFPDYIFLEETKSSWEAGDGKFFWNNGCSTIFLPLFEIKHNTNASSTSSNVPVEFVMLWVRVTRLFDLKGFSYCLAKTLIAGMHLQALC